MALGRLKVKTVVQIGCIIFLWALLVFVWWPENLGRGTLYSETCWVPEGRQSCAPHFIIAGSMKCGTTSIWTYLLQHPDVLPLVSVQIDPQKIRTVLAEKEVRFFNEPGYTKLADTYGKAKAFEYYLNLFAPIPPTRDQGDPTNFGKITGEATPMYINDLKAAERIHESLPNVKIIITLRNPIDRAYSDYWFRKSLKVKSNEQLGSLYAKENQKIFSTCMNSEIDMIQHCLLQDWIIDPTTVGSHQFLSCYRSISKMIIGANATSETCTLGIHKHLCIPDDIRSNCQPYGLLSGIYVYQLIEWLDVFPPENLLILRSEILFDSPEQYMEQVAEFLSLKSFDWGRVTEKAYNIINPGGLHATKHELVTTNMQAKNKLQVGASERTSDYPPLDREIRAQLLSRVAPYNEALARMTGDDSFLEWNSKVNN